MREQHIARPLVALWRAGSVAGLLTAAIVVLAGSPAQEVALWTLGASAILLGSLALGTLYLSMRQSGRVLGLGTVIFATLSIISVMVPGAELEAGTRESVLEVLRSPIAPTDGIAAVYLLFAGCLSAFSLGESMTAERLHASSAAGTPRYLQGNPTLYVTLAALGLVGLALGHGGHSQAAFVNRAQVRGAGAETLLSDCLPSAVALGLLSRHWKRGRFALCSAALLGVFALETTSRSPLIFVGIAAGLRFLGSLKGRGIRIRTAAAVVSLLYVIAVFVVAFDQYRGQVTRSGSASVAQIITTAAADPFTQLASKGTLDTFDGCILALHVSPSAVHASIFDPLKAVYELVPYQLWPTKPPFLGSSVTHLYTDFGGNAGIFLSGPGYLYIVYRGAVGAVAAFAILGWGIGGLLRRLQRSAILEAYVLYFLVRFIVGGDAFDGLYVLTQLSGVLVAWALARGVMGLSRCERRAPEAQSGVEGHRAYRLGAGQ